MGTLINVAGITCGGLVGLFAGKLLTARFRKILNIAMGLCIIGLSIAGMMAEMLVISDDGITTTGTYVLIFSLVPGCIIGEMIDIDRQMERFGKWLRDKTGNTKTKGFVNGFVTAALGIGCIFSAIPVGIWQGLITVLAGLLAPIISDQAIGNISLVGSALILCMGVNIMMEDSTKRIKVANLMPAIIFAVIAAYIPFIS